jgi:DNA polymerase-3 subunit epsilon
VTHWADQRLLAFDVETTAPDPEEARIVQYAIGYVGGGQPTEIVAPLVNPGVEIPAGATEVHGITTERARAEGRDAREAVEILSGIICATIEGGSPIVAFNARFDLTVLDRECRRHGVLVPEWERALVVDPFVIDKFLHRFRKGSRKLAAVCEHYGAELDEAHEAGADAIAAARLAWVIAKRGEAVARYPDILTVGGEWNRVKDVLPALHMAQVKWALVQAKGLREYFERTGKAEEAAGVRGDWPVVPFVAQQEMAA